MEKQPDIEIYLKECPMDKLVEWLTSLFGKIESPLEAGDSEVFHSSIGPIIITPTIEDSEFISVWFNTPNSPWLTDVECARQASILNFACFNNTFFEFRNRRKASKMSIFLQLERHFTNNWP